MELDKELRISLNHNSDKRLAIQILLTIMKVNNVNKDEALLIFKRDFYS